MVVYRIYKGMDEAPPDCSKRNFSGFQIGKCQSSDLEIESELIIHIYNNCYKVLDLIIIHEQ